MSEEVDKKKVAYGIVVILLSVLASYFIQPLIHGNQDAINVIVTMFSILAGFLVAVITVIGDPKSLPSGGWQLARLGSDRTYNRLIRHKWLFKGYLITLFFIFFSIVAKNSFPSIQVAFEYVYMFFASVSCFLSFKLPSALMELQMERIEQEIEVRRKNEGVEG